MAYSQVPPEMDLNTQCFSPRIGGSHCDQLTNCYQQLAEYSLNKGYSRQSILKQTIFITVTDKSEYHQSKRKLLDCAKIFFYELPPTSILAQSPEITSLLLEVLLVDEMQSNELFYRHNDDSSWLIFQRGNTKMLIAAGLCETVKLNNILQQSNEVFRQLDRILSEENMEFSDIVRQWNYIEQITENGIGRAHV